MINELRLARAAERLCTLHPRVVAELLAEIGRAYDIADDVLCRTEAFAATDPDILRAVGGNRFPPSIREVA